MIDGFDVPQAYQAAFRRLRRRIPVDLQADPAVMETALLYLKLGGEKLALHRLALHKKQFESECRLFRSRLTDEDIEEEGEDGEDVENDEGGEREDGEKGASSGAEGDADAPDED